MAVPHEAASSRPGPGVASIALVAAIRESLSPYPWRALTAEMVTALAIAAGDGTRATRDRARYARAFARRRDERVPAVAGVLGADPHWRRRPADVVARRLAVAMTAEAERRVWFDLELAWLLDPPS